VAEQPPQTFGAAHVPVGDDEGTVTDACLAGRTREIGRIGQRMSPAGTGWRREIGVDVEKARAGNMLRPVKVPASLRLAELPATVDELVAQAYQLPLDGGKATDDG
jgi:hypothetical protein